MSKKFISIKKFDGGRNSVTDPRDLLPEEHVEVQNLHTNQKGKLVAMGATGKNFDYLEANGQPLPGYGLHTYGSGWGFNPIGTGLTGTHTQITAGQDGWTGTLGIHWNLIPYSYPDPNSVWWQNIICPTSFNPDSGTSGAYLITRRDSFNCIVCGMFLQLWKTLDQGTTFVPDGNPVPLFGTSTGNNYNQIVTDGSHSMGGNGATLPNGAKRVSGAWHMPWNVTTFDPDGVLDTGYVKTYKRCGVGGSNDATGQIGEGAAEDYTDANFAVICTLNNTDTLTNDFGQNYYFDGNYSSENNINKVFAQSTDSALVSNFVSLINVNSGVSGFEAVAGNGGEFIHITEKNPGAGKKFSTFSTYQRSDEYNDIDGASTHCNFNDPPSWGNEGVNWPSEYKHTTGADYKIGASFSYRHATPWQPYEDPLGNVFGGYYGDASSSVFTAVTVYDWAKNTGTFVIPDLFITSGWVGDDSFGVIYDTDNTVYRAHNAFKGAMNWWVQAFYDSDNYGFQYFNTSGLGIHDSGGVAIEHHHLKTLHSRDEPDWSDIPPTPESNVYMEHVMSNVDGVSRYGSPKWYQEDHITFTGTPAAGEMWIVNINGSEHKVTHGVDPGNGAAPTSTLSHWADAMAYKIQGGLTEDGAASQAANVTATVPSGAIVKIIADTIGFAGMFGCSSYTNDRRFGQEDDERLAYINKSGILQVHSSSVSNWIADSQINDLGWSNPTTIKPVMYSEGGTLRICDATFVNSNSAKTMQYYETGDLCGVTDLKFQGHKLFDQSLDWRYTYGTPAADKGIIRRAAMGDSDWNTAVGSSANITTQRWLFNFEPDDSTAGSWNGLHKFYVSAVYADGSESLPSHSFTNNGSAVGSSYTDSPDDVAFDFAADNSLKLRVVGFPKDTTDWMFDKRIVGMRIYHTKEEDQYGIYYEVALVHFRDGLVSPGSGVAIPWSSNIQGGAGGGSLQSCTGSTDIYSTNFQRITDVNEDNTFEYITGYDSHSKSLSADYQHAAMTGRRVWIAGVKYLDDFGVERVYNDRIIASPVNMFDVFPTPGNVIDIDTSDGDNITSMHASHGRILEFKNKTLYILNVADSDLSTAFIESTHPYRGVSRPYHVVEVPNGLAWANSYGVFYFEGDEVVNLFETEDDQIVIGDLEWRDFFNTNSLVGYAPLDDILIIKKSCDKTAFTNHADMFVYEFATKSWVYGEDKMVRNQDCTNFVVLGDGTLIVMGDTQGGVDTNPGVPT